MGTGHHALTHAQPGNALPDRLDFTGHLVAQDTWRLRCWGIQPDTSHGVSEVEACGAHRDSNLVRSDGWVGSFQNLEHLRTASSREHHSLHDRKSTLRRQRPCLESCYLANQPRFTATTYRVRHSVPPGRR